MSTVVNDVRNSNWCIIWSVFYILCQWFWMMSVREIGYSNIQENIFMSFYNLNVIKVWTTSIKHKTIGTYNSVILPIIISNCLFYCSGHQWLRDFYIIKLSLLIISVNSCNACMFYFCSNRLDLIWTTTPSAALFKTVSETEQ